MNLCIPVEKDQGLASPVCAHFGSAPAFVIVRPMAPGMACAHHGHGHP